MIGDSKMSISVVMAVILVIVVTVSIYSFFFGNVSASGVYAAPVEKGSCSSSMDCQRGVCASIDGRPNACVCFGNEQCGASYECVDNACQRVSQ